MTERVQIGRRHKLSVLLAGDAPPAEFRIFTAGVVDTSKGRFVFDEAAALAVLSEYEAQGNTLMIDYDHASLSPAPVDPAQAGKAAGWFDLEVRGGELWAVNVRWTQPAAEALQRKEWRYMSPAFTTDADGRITSLMNVAITNIPATRKLEPLMAASLIAASLGGQMDPKAVQEALDALIAGDAEKCAELLKGMIASAAAGEAAPPEEPQAAAEQAAANADPAAQPAEEEEKPAEAMAASAKLFRLTCKDSIAAAVAEVEIWRASHVELETERQKLAAERAVLESAERRKLCADLVRLAGKRPAEVWADDTATAPKKYLASMPIADFRDFVADAIKASGKPQAVQPPKRGDAPAAGGDGSKVFATALGPITLSASELAACDAAGAKPEIYATNKAVRDSQRRTRGGK